MASAPVRTSVRRVCARASAEIEWALAALPGEQREAFLLRHVEQLSYAEMMAVTGAGGSALKMRVQRACRRLQELLDDDTRRISGAP